MITKLGASRLGKLRASAPQNRVPGGSRDHRLVSAQPRRTRWSSDSLSMIASQSATRSCAGVWL
jgi:hypothetical protein